MAREVKMPNIELHGFNVESIEMKKKIFDLFKEDKVKDEIVVTIYQDAVYDKNNKSQPFIRLVSTVSENLSMIKARLMTLKVDLEEMFLNNFHPKK
jgi:hypothetical protein